MDGQSIIDVGFNLLCSRSAWWIIRHSSNENYVQGCELQVWRKRIYSGDNCHRRREKDSPSRWDLRIIGSWLEGSRKWLLIIGNSSDLLKSLRGRVRCSPPQAKKRICFFKDSCTLGKAFIKSQDHCHSSWTRNVINDERSDCWLLASHDSKESTIQDLFGLMAN